MGFFATFWAWLNGQLATYIGDNTASLAGVLEPAVVTLATVYVMVWGYLHLTGKIDGSICAIRSPSTRSSGARFRSNTSATRARFSSIFPRPCMPARSTPSTFTIPAIPSPSAASAV